MLSSSGRHRWRRWSALELLLVVLLAAFITAAVLVESGGGKASARRRATPVAAARGTRPARRARRGRSRAAARLVAVDSALRPQLLALDPPPHHQALPHLSGV